MVGFNYFVTNTISAPATVTDYQIKRIVHYGVGTNSGEDLYCNNHCRGDFNDIRFEDPDGIALSHWRETYTEYDSAIFWIKVPTIEASTEIVVKYGNAEAASESDPINTFEFYDAFQGTTIDGTKWSGAVNTITYDVNNRLRITSASDAWIEDNTDTGAQLRSTWTPITNCKIIWKSTIHMESAEEMGQAGVAFVDSSDKIQVSNLHTDGDSDEIVAGCYGNAETAIYDFNNGVNDESRVFAITKRGSRFTLKHRAYGTTRWENDITHTITAAVARMVLAAGKKVGSAFCNYFDIDWIYIRKYEDPEPDAGTWTQESVSFKDFESLYNLLPDPYVDPANIRFYRSEYETGGNIDLNRLQVSSVVGNEISRISKTERELGTTRYVKQFVRNENNMAWGPLKVFLSALTQYAPYTEISFVLAGSKSMATTSAVLSGTATFTATGYLTTSNDLRGEVCAGECVYNSSDDGVTRANKITEVASTYIQLESAYIGTLGSGKQISVAPATMSRYISPVSGSDSISPTVILDAYGSVGVWKCYRVLENAPQFANDYFTLKLEEED